MKIVPGSHTAGVDLKHQRYNPGETDSGVLTLLLEEGSFREDTAVSLCLRPGQVSLHWTTVAVHGSLADLLRWAEGRPDVRYSGTDVKHDLRCQTELQGLPSVWGPCDRYHNNPPGVPPLTESRADRRLSLVSLEEAGKAQ